MPNPTWCTPQPIYPKIIQSIVDKCKNCSAIGKMEITLVWAQKERCTLIFKSLLEWPGLFDLSYSVSAFMSLVHSNFIAKHFYLYCVRDNLIPKIVLFFELCNLVRVVPLMIHVLNVKKHNCGYASRKK